MAEVTVTLPGPGDDSPLMTRRQVSKLKQLTAYCLGCKKRSMITDQEESQNATGRRIVKGKCASENCGKAVTRFLESHDSVIEE
jgi:hypothetical protein